MPYPVELTAFVAAWRAPQAIATDLSSLLAEPEALAPRSASGGIARAPRAMRQAQRALRALARLPGGPWKTTCLFRSVTECLLLRQLGLAARVVIGVDRTGAAADVVAHAWVECERVRPTCTSGTASYRTLARP